MATTDRLMKGSNRQLAPTATAPALEGGEEVEEVGELEEAEGVEVV